MSQNYTFAPLGWKPKLLRDRMTPVFYPYLRVHMDPQHTFDPRDDEIDLFELFESLWRRGY